MNKSPTTRELAQELGLSHSAVAAALRGDARTSEATRKRILEYAKKRGYVFNPAARALASQRFTSKQSAFNIATFSTGVGSTLKVPLFTHCRTHANTLGYGYEFLHSKTIPSTRRLKNVIEARGIGGLLINTLGPGFHPFDFSQLSIPLVKIHGGLPSVAADMVTYDHYLHTSQAFQHAWERGYRRIGITLPSRDYILNGNRIYSRTLIGLMHERHIPIDYNPVFEAPHPSSKSSLSATWDWFRNNKIDCVIAHNTEFIRYLQERGFRIPEDVGALGLYINEETARSFVPTLSGFTSIAERLALASVRQIDSLIRHPDQGENSGNTTILVQPEYFQGESLRPES